MREPAAARAGALNFPKAEIRGGPPQAVGLEFPKSGNSRLAVGAAACAALLTAACSTPPHKRTLDDLLNHPARKPEYWARFDRTRPLEDKIYAATPELVDMLSLDNELNGYPEHPSSATLDPALVQDLKSALLELPAPLRQRIGKRFLGFFLVHQLGGTAFTDVELNPDKSPGGIFMMIDVESVNRKANEWMSWKESSPFKPEPGYSLEGVIEKPENDNRSHALQYILLHEMGHMYSVDTRAHPLWTKKLDEIKSLDGYDYINLTWKLNPAAPKDAGPSQRYLSVFDGDFPERQKIQYYSLSKSEIPLSKAPDAYRSLLRTNIPTMYGATNPYDDFAELFVQYVHTVLLHKPWVVRIKNGEKVVFELPACAPTHRCAKKRRMLEKYLRADGVLPPA